MNPNFKLIKEEEIEDINGTGYFYKHLKTKAKIVYFKTNDKNKVFTIAFRTPAVSNQGICHILEHSLLCGSKKYDIKDPYNYLASSSLQTFLNAITFPDKTLYPVASLNDKDFKNLIDVYLDGVFNPNLLKNKNIFYQEGFHYEHKDGKLIPNGVVYNEMKGVYQSPYERLTKLINENLYKGTSYVYENGGLPKDIIHLTYDDLIKYYKYYYHPSNAYFYLYGDLNIDDYLTYFDEILSNYEYKKIKSELKEVKRFKKNEIVTAYYEIEEDKDLIDNTYIAISYLLKRKDPLLLLGLSILINQCFLMPGAPFKELIIKNKLAKDIDVAFQTDTKEPSLSIILIGSNEVKLEIFIKLLDDFLENYKIKDEDVINALNFIEFKKREKKFSSTPYGLGVILGSLQTLLYSDNDPFSGLSTLEVLEEAKSLLKKDFFNDIKINYLKNNPYKKYFLLMPSYDAYKKEDLALEKEIHRYYLSLSKVNLKSLDESNEALAKYHDLTDDTSKMPKLSLDDLNNDYYDFKIEDKGNYLYSDYDTTGIIYFKYLFKLSKLGIDTVHKLALIKDFLLDFDTKNYKYNELNNLILGNSGGIGFNLNIYEPLGEEPYLAFVINGSVLEKNFKKINDLILEVIHNTIFSKERLKEKISELKLNYEENIQSLAYSLSSMYGASFMSLRGKYYEEINGLSYYNYLKSIDFNNLDSLILDLNNLLTKIFSKSSLLVHITTDNVILKNIDNDISLFKGSLGNDKLANEEYNFKPSFNKKIGIIAKLDVNYVTKIYQFNPQLFSGKLMLLSLIINNNYLYNEVRIKNGAYGVSSYANQYGQFNFRSFHDPNIKKTLDIYDETSNFISNLALTDAEFTNQIISTIGNIEQPSHVKTISEIALNRYLAKRDNDYYLSIRNDIINAKLNDLHSLAKVISDKANYVIFGSEEEINKNSDLFEEIIKF